ncbi:MAG: hypothetical protein CMJ64_09250 [Planctomycetaceae bacterium]|nr:hypothetical protein [Planctomycetaceae bacterium]
MLRLIVSLAICLILASRSAIADETVAAKQYKALLDEYEQEGGVRTFAKRFLALAEEHWKDPAATDALMWVVKKVRGRADTTRALELLAANHLDCKKLGAASVDVARSRSLAAEKLLRAALAKSPHVEVRAQACYYLALLLDSEAGITEQLKASPDLAPRVLQYYGADYGKHLSSLDSGELAEEREQVYETLLKSFGNVETEDATLGKIAEKALFAIRHLAVGKVAPEIQGEDIRGNELKLSDYRGKVVMISFWGDW